MLFLVVFLVLLNGFFVAAEFALVKVRQTYLEQLENQGNKKATTTKKVVSNLNVYLNTCQFGITLASLALGWIGEPAIAHLIEPITKIIGLSDVAIHGVSVVIAFIVVTFLHIVLGEIVPKTIAIQKADMISLWSAGILMFFYRISLPAVWLLNTSSNIVLKLIGIKPTNEHEVAHTEEELRLLMDHSLKSGHINSTEMNLIEGAFDFADRVVRQVMVPRVDIVVLSIDDSYETVMKTIKEEQYTRYPVIREDKDDIVGYVHIKDLIVANTDDFSLSKYVRKIETLLESTESSDALNVMRKSRNPIAIILDEYGGTAGMITMEDLLEEIVDEIRDEFDSEELPPIQEVNNDGYSVDGKVLIDVINDLTGLEIQVEEVETIAGWMYHTLSGDIGMGKSVIEKEFIFTIQKMSDNHIERIDIKKSNK